MSLTPSTLADVADTLISPRLRPARRAALAPGLPLGAGRRHTGADRRGAGDPTRGAAPPGRPPAVRLAPLFVVPVVNVVLATVLALVPGDEPRRPPSLLERLVPGSAFGSAVVGVVLALPITLGVGLLGAFVGYLSQSRGAARPGAQLVSAAVLVLPLLMGSEALQGREPPLRSVTSQIVVDAPPAVVWRHVVAVEPLPEKRELVFRLGIAYPTRAVIHGRGVGAVRRCRFSTGDFVEPITVWDPPRRLEFRVASQPPPMRELSPWGNIHPPHLDGFLLSTQGRFVLRRLPGSRTLLLGTSWYENRMWPQTYWAVWSDSLIHRIHLRVLRHVKAVSEADTS